MDLEINDHPVHINMKLDDTGAAFFVEEIEEGDEDSDWAGLATSPIPDQRGLDWSARKIGVLKPTSLFETENEAVEDEETMAIPLPTEDTPKEASEEEDMEEEGTPEPEGRKGKLNKKKRKRRSQLRASRRGSKSNIFQKDVQTVRKFVEDDMFAMDDMEEQTSAITDTSELPIHNSPRRHMSAPSRESESNEDSKDLTNLVEPLQAVFLEEQVEGLLTRTMSVSSNFHYFPGKMGEEADVLQVRPETAPTSGETSEVWRWGKPMTKDPLSVVPDVQEFVGEEKLKEEGNENGESKQKSSWLGIFQGTRHSDSRGTEGVYLDEILNNPEKMAVYLQPSRGPLEVAVGPSDPLDLSRIPRSGLDLVRDEDCESGHGPSLPMSPQSYEGPLSRTVPSSPTSDLTTLASRYIPDLAVSLCGGLQDRSITPDQFASGLLSHEQFLQKIKETSPLLEDPDFVVRLHEKYVSWSTASPILFSLMFFKKPLPTEAVEEMLKLGLPVNLNLSADEVTSEKSNKKESWFGGWFGGGANETQAADEVQAGDEVQSETAIEEIKTEPAEEKPTLSVSIPSTPRTRLNTETNSSDSDLGDKKKYRKTLYLTSEQLRSLNLKKGSNEVEFSVTTAFQGTTTARCHIYLWHHTDKVVISDIDGTITKSDVFGQILPMIGKDWAQSGVAQLFSRIRANGYQVMYLSARAIGQASMTKGYLESLRQCDVCLPDGPVFLNPDSLFYAFKREVIDKNPEEFKIRCLKDIDALFENKNPFFAGYGNKPNVSR